MEGGGWEEDLDGTGQLGRLSVSGYATGRETSCGLREVVHERVRETRISRIPRRKCWAPKVLSIASHPDEVLSIASHPNPYPPHPPRSPPRTPLPKWRSSNS